MGILKKPYQVSYLILSTYAFEIRKFFDNKNWKKLRESKDYLFASNLW